MLAKNSDLVQKMLSVNASDRPSAEELQAWAGSADRNSADCMATAHLSAVQQTWSRLQQVPKAPPFSAVKHFGMGKGDSAQPAAQGMALGGIFKGRTASSLVAKETKRKLADPKAGKKGSSKQATLTMTKIFQ
jgi:hypothetical protein